jgi:1,4-alpha-glucan branching enzyme
MKRLLPMALFGLAMTMIGCAGGWRGDVAPGAAVTAPAVKAAPAAGGTAAGAEGVSFVWKGEGGSVNLAGEFNGWNTSADPMKKQADGSWTLTKKLEPGRYMYKFVVDGTNWKEDPTAKETTDDGYGGKNSVVVVGGAAAAAAPAVKAAPAAGGTAAGAEGVSFVWKGEGGSVNLAGEFNGWNTSADPMKKQADGSWTLTKKLEPGRYMYKFVIDGTNWKEDPTAKESNDDGYGGKNSVVVVGGGAAAAAAPAASAAAPATPTASGKGRAPQPTAGGVIFTFGGAARSVSLAGDFNGWALAADPLAQQTDGSWTITKQLAPGTYEYKFLVDGTTWKTDEANPDSKADPYGGRNSVVTVK